MKTKRQAGYVHLTIAPDSKQEKHSHKQKDGNTHPRQREPDEPGGQQFGRGDEYG